MSSVVMRASRMKKASAAPAKVSSSLATLETFFRRSSPMPPRKAGRPQRIRVRPRDSKSRPVHSAPAMTPPKIARPPMRGVAFLWIFCGKSESAAMLWGSW